MSPGSSTPRADHRQPQRGAALARRAHPLRGNARAYVGRALGQEWGAPWLVHGLRVLGFLACGLIFGALALMGAD